jgi:hypothetical protein
MRFSEWWLWRVSSSGIWCRVVHWVATDVSEERIASIFRVEELVQQTSEQAGAELILRPWIWRRYIPPKRRVQLNGLHGVISPEDSTLRNHRCENLKSYKKDFTVSLKLSESNTLPVLAELISSALKMEAICSSETSVLVQRKLSRN